ncbi:conserved hypothetical protein [Neospora caninum Liverpool]|uniref:Uncharacterized protein n=1 Tax=Neospora caninum (strain Liverpool) TaxID=572307 RepID=F0VCK2_NEOCL|nr:conserved hypothetical protein [Neospora caninum Liverpool]CBZ51691.1 conserved hypothetical protein [Neospora caninum Liverpool]|eukprot:XP_003881724.1 conserved hypothetical protein [Neospora caninum Liverpool]
MQREPAGEGVREPPMPTPPCSAGTDASSLVGAPGRNGQTPAGVDAGTAPEDLRACLPSSRERRAYSPAPSSRTEGTTLGPKEQQSLQTERTRRIGSEQDALGPLPASGSTQVSRQDHPASLRVLPDGRGAPRIEEKERGRQTLSKTRSGKRGLCLENPVEGKRSAACGPWGLWETLESVSASPGDEDACHIYRSSSSLPEITPRRQKSAPTPSPLSSCSSLCSAPRPSSSSPSSPPELALRAERSFPPRLLERAHSVGASATRARRDRPEGNVEDGPKRSWKEVDTRKRLLHSKRAPCRETEETPLHGTEAEVCRRSLRGRQRVAAGSGGEASGAARVKKQPLTTGGCAREEPETARVFSPGPEETHADTSAEDDASSDEKKPGNPDLSESLKAIPVGRVAALKQKLERRMERRRQVRS